MKHLLYTELTFNMLVELITKYHSAKDKDVRNLVIKNNNDHKGMVAGASAIRVVGMGVVIVASFPLAICKSSPASPVNSTASIP